MKGWPPEMPKQLRVIGWSSAVLLALVLAAWFLGERGLLALVAGLCWGLFVGYAHGLNEGREQGERSMLLELYDFECLDDEDLDKMYSFRRQMLDELISQRARAHHSGAL